LITLKTMKGKYPLHIITVDTNSTTPIPVLTIHDYIRILEYYQYSIPKSSKQIRIQAEQLIQQQLCRRIQSPNHFNYHSNSNLNHGRTLRKPPLPLLFSV